MAYLSRVASATTRKAIWFISGLGALLGGLRFGFGFRLDFGFLGMGESVAPLGLAFKGV
jgi:hypothetical protein